ncbi:MAG: patatin-like phospholipase family protein [Prolixibacteraceae bacterium]|nr:patatin-like phospholipase family protein [Prolixibacteraceae bacterium]
MAKKYKIGLVLSGGGTRGFSHLGTIKALIENGIKPDIISGVSAGAIVGAFFSSGKTPDEIHTFLKKGGFFRYTKMQLPVDGLLRLDGLKEILDAEIEYKKIENLPIPLFITVSNLNKGVVEYINEGPVSRTVLASSSIPILFSPVKLNHELYVDGGLMNNVPLQPIVEDCEKLIVSNISPIHPKSDIKNLIQITARTFYMSVNPNTKKIRKKSWLYIEPEGIDKYDILSRAHADELFELGYNSAKKALETIDY